ncbi:MAG: FtsB family cell division protein [Alphaproteobacteria bacterium]
MHRFFPQNHFIRQNIVALVAVAVCFYFVYHTFQGNRSLARLLNQNNEIATMSLKYDTKKAERIALEKKVVMMRPGSLDRDLLEERAKAVLGYKNKDEFVVLPE